MTKIMYFCGDFFRGMKYCRNILCRKEILGKKLRATGRNFLSQEEISCDRKKFLVTGRHFLTQDVTGRHFLSQEENSCPRKNFHLKGQHFKPQEKMSYNTKKFPFARRNFLSQEEIPNLRRKFPDEISSHRTKFSVTGRNFFQRKKFSACRNCKKEPSRLSCMDG